MCLSRISKKLKPVKTGYVVVRKTAGGNYTPHIYDSRLIDGRFEVVAAKPRVWYQSNGRKDRRYERGFHVWHTLEDARAWAAPPAIDEVIVKVEVRKVICVGMNETGFGLRKGAVTVARERRILHEVK